jgi:4-amino-4-deoxy-L-arabinose transferase-like glycosyltransferase
VALLALGFLGNRGLWEPDEGRYVEVAREMVVAGDYVIPTLNGIPHFTKPPLTYWTVAAGLRLVGQNEWGARLGHGLAFAATALLVALLGEQLVGSPRGRWAAVVYATMLLPFVAGSLITPDGVLGLCQTWALFAFWKGWTAAAPAWARGWMVGFWVGVGAAFLAKGPPALLPVAVVLPFALLAPPPAAGLTRAVWLRPAGLVVFLALALSWFLLVVESHLGLARYLLREEVVGRIATSVHHRNSRWYMGLVIYPATVLVGALPWSLTWLPAARRWGIRNPWPWLRADPARLFLAAWIAIPPALLTLARSRLPLYLLLVFPALALATCLGGRASRAAGGSPAVVPWLAVWVATLLGLRVLGAWYPAPQDTRALARWIEGHVGPDRTEVVVVDERVFGLPVYLGVRVEMISRRAQPSPEYQATSEPWEEEVSELGQAPYRHLFLLRGQTVPAFKQQLAGQAVSCEEAAGPRNYSLLICEAPKARRPAS